MTRQPGRGLQVLAMLALPLLVGALSLGDTGWAQVARAQTVPTLTFTPGPTLAATPRPTAILPSATPATPAADGSGTVQASVTVPAGSASSPVLTLAPVSTGTPLPALAACGPGPYSLAVAVRRAPVDLTLGVGRVTLLALDALEQPGATPFAISTFSAQTVPHDQLVLAPTGWQFLGCGLQTTAEGPAGAQADFLSGGLAACLIPLADANPISERRLAYFDARPNIRRWVFVPSQVVGGALCSLRFHLMATFALLTRSL